nr:hypothetical protein [uncultured Schaedlerella sp.]
MKMIKKIKQKLKTIQRNNPELFQWIVSGLIFFPTTIISFILRLITWYY